MTRRDALQLLGLGAVASGVLAYILSIGGEEESYEFLIRLRDKPNTTKKGHFITFKPAGWTWGSNELKHYGIVKITCSYEQAQALCAGYVDTTKVVGSFEYENSRLARVHKFDFEAVLSSSELANWVDQKDSSKVIDITMIDVVQEVIE